MDETNEGGREGGREGGHEHTKELTNERVEQGHHHQHQHSRRIQCPRISIIFEEVRLHAFAEGEVGREGDEEVGKSAAG